jgi:hypothetical protein
MVYWDGKIRHALKSAILTHNLKLLEVKEIHLEDTRAMFEGADEQPPLELEKY